MILSAALFVLAQTAAAAAPATPPAGTVRTAPAQQVTTKSAIDAEVRTLFQKMDANHDGRVDRAEADKFRADAQNAQLARRKQVVAGAFAKVDTNKDGMISRQEFEAASVPAPPAANAANPWFAANDIDRNGRVELNEAIAKAERNFEMLDKDKNGVLSAQELNVLRNRRAGAAR